MNRRLATIAAVLTLLPAFPAGLKAADAPREIRWVELMPPAESMPSPLKPKAFFSGSTTAPPDGGPPPPPLPEGKWLSFKRKQPGADQPPRVVADLNGKRVKI